MKGLTFLATILLFISCSNNSQNIIDIPDNEIDQSLQLKYQSIIQQLGLQLNSNQSFVRFWEEEALVNGIWMKQFIIDSNQVVQCNFDLYISTRDKNTDKLLERPSLDSALVWCKPNTQLPRILQDILAAGLDTLKSQNDYSDFENIVLDGTIYSIEISKKNYYKFITYHCPGAYSSNASNNKFTEIASMLVDTAYTTCLTESDTYH